MATPTSVGRGRATVNDSLITHNQAVGGHKGAGGSDGHGVGGGVYDLGTFTCRHGDRDQEQPRFHQQRQRLPVRRAKGPRAGSKCRLPDRLAG